MSQDNARLHTQAASPPRRAAAGLAHAPNGVRQAVAAPGLPLNEQQRVDMEARFGWDFRDVRIHDDCSAAASATALGAAAYTVGSHIVFGPGRFAPHTPAGQRLLAHELTHVVQHRGAGSTEGGDGERAEAEARRVGLTAGPVGPISAYVSPGMLLMEGEAEAPAEAAAEEPGFWGTVGGGLMGEFNEDQNFAMIGVDVGVSLIPVLDQASDVRDVIAHLYYLIVRRQYDRFMRWLGVVFTLIGLIPELGSAIKGASKFILRGIEVLIAHLADFVRPLLRFLPGGGDLLVRLQEFVVRNWDRIVSTGMSSWQRTVDRVSRLVAMIPAFVGGRLRALRDLWGRIVEMAPGRLTQAFAWARRQWDEALEAVRRRLRPGDATPGRTTTPRSAGDEIDDAFARLERGETPQDAALLQDLLHHSQQQEALDQLRRSTGTPMSGRPGPTPHGATVNPSPGYQSAHTTPQSALRTLPQYDPGEMITRILPTGRGHAHTVFDQAWQREYRHIRHLTGRTTTTAQELYDVIARAARNSGAFPPNEAESMVGLIFEDLFVRLGLAPSQVLRMPGN